MLALRQFAGVIYNLVVFSAIGFWPVYWSCRSRDRLLTAAAIAPTLGFAITTLVTTYLVLLDWPVKSWGLGYTLLGVVFAAGTIGYVLRKRAAGQAGTATEKRELIWMIAGNLIVILVILLPMLVGRTAFTTMRGNSYDDLYYMSMAGYLDREPFSWIQTASTSEMIARDSSYILVSQLLEGRWTTSAALALTSRTAGLPIYQFEYPYTSLFFIMTFGPCFMLARRLKLSILYALCTAAVVSTGFWAQVVMDMRAFSEINSLPLLLSFCVVAMEAVGQEIIDLRMEPVLLGIMAVSLVFCYTEIVPLLALGMALFLGLRALRHGLPASHGKAILFLLILIGLGAAPLLQHLGRFGYAALSGAASIPRNWEQSYFAWLYSNPLIGFWGLSPLVSVFDHPSIPALVVLGTVLLTAFGGVLALITIYVLIRSLVAKDADDAWRLVASLAVSSLLECGFLLAKQQRWAAAKALAYGYPFFILLVSAATLYRARVAVPTHRALSTVVFAMAVFWVASQLGLGMVRVAVATTGKEFVNDVSNVRGYRAYDYEFSAITGSLAREENAVVWTVIPDGFAEQFVNLVLGADHHVVDTFGVRDSDNNLLGVQDMSRLPGYLLTNRIALRDNPTWDAYSVAGNADFVLFRMPKERFFFYTLSAANGPGKWEGKHVAWIGADGTTLDVIASGYCRLRFSASFLLGPSLPNSVQTRLRILDSISGSPQTYLVVPGSREFIFPLGMGKTSIAFTDPDIPVITGPRAQNTLLAMTGIGLEPSPCP